MEALTTASVVGEPVTAQYVLDMGCRWKPGSTLTVAFSCGTPDLRPKIETPACTINVLFTVAHELKITL